MDPVTKAKLEFNINKINDFQSTLLGLHRIKDTEEYNKLQDQMGQFLNETLVLIKDIEEEAYKIFNKLIENTKIKD
ncbi:MAG: hypothetical protein H0Z40_01405 [Desulfotomaculum sp.]|nr:hypothetical protein [Desulfotomaculum sp.]